MIEATERLYETFARYPLKTRIEGCAHCELGQSESSLHSRELAKLSWDDLGVYPFKAITTFGDVNDFRHFLPRILELYVLDYSRAWYDLEIVLRKIRHAGWVAWPEREVQAIRTFLAAWLDELRSRSLPPGEDNGELDEVLSALESAGINLSDAV